MSRHEEELAYAAWRSVRWEAIERSCPAEWWDGKTVLELGCRGGEFGNMLHEFGADVTCADARPWFLDRVRRNFSHLRAIRLDLNRDPIGEEYDVVVHMGVLYHLSAPAFSIGEACHAAGEMLIMESQVTDYDSLDSFPLIEAHGGAHTDQAIDGRACRPTPYWIETQLGLAGFGLQHRVRPENCAVHRYDWVARHEGAAGPGLRAMWLCWRS